MLSASAVASKRVSPQEILDAIRDGQLEIVERYIVENKGNKEAFSSVLNRPLLHSAVARTRKLPAAVLRALLSEVAVDPNETAFAGRTVLHAVAETDCQENCAILLCHPGLDLHKTATNGLTACELARAMQTGLNSMIEAEQYARQQEQRLLSTSAVTLPEFFAAARSGDIRKVRRFIARNRNNPHVLNARNERGESAFHVAVAAKNEAIVNIFAAEPNMNANAITNAGETLVALAVGVGSFNMLNRIVSIPYLSVNVLNRDKKNLQDLADTLGKPNIISLVDFTVNDRQSFRLRSETLLFLGSVTQGNKAATQVCIGSHRDNATATHFIDFEGKNALHRAVGSNNKPMVELLLPVIDPRLVDVNGVSALQLAKDSGHEEIYKLLEAAIVPVPAPASSPSSSTIALSALRKNKLKHEKAFLKAAEDGDVASVEALLKKLTDAHEVENAQGQNALHIAVIWGRLPVVEALLKARFNPNCVDSQKDTALHIAARKGDAVIVKKLLEVKAIDLEAQNAQGITAIKEAKHHGHIILARRIQGVFANQAKERTNCATALDKIEADMNKGVVDESKKRFITVPPDITDIVNFGLMRDPVGFSSGGIFDRGAIERQFAGPLPKQTVTCPETRREILMEELEYGTNVDVMIRGSRFVAKLRGLSG